MPVKSQSEYDSKEKAFTIEKPRKKKKQRKKTRKSRYDHIEETK